MLELDLSSNDLRVAGAKAMAALLSHDTLKSLELASNRLHDFGVKAFGVALEPNRHLKFLGLAENKISDVGVEVLAKALSANETLELLEMDYNLLTDAGAARLKALHCEVTLAGNQAGHRGY